MSPIFRLKNCLPKRPPNFSIDEGCDELRERRQAVMKCIESVSTRNGASSHCRDYRAPSTQVAWHYTIGQHFISILNTGALLPTDVLILSDEVPALWFSLNQAWEPTASKAMITSDGIFVGLTKEETRQLGGGLVRFGYLPELLLPWSQLRRQANIGRKRVKGLEMAGYRQGAIPAQWMGCLHAIPVDDLIIEIWDGTRWNCIQNPAAGDLWAWHQGMKDAA